MDRTLYRYRTNTWLALVAGLTAGGLVEFSLQYLVLGLIPGYFTIPLALALWGSLFYTLFEAFQLTHRRLAIAALILIILLVYPVFLVFYPMVFLSIQTFGATESEAAGQFILFWLIGVIGGVISIFVCRAVSQPEWVPRNARAERIIAQSKS